MLLIEIPDNNRIIFELTLNGQKYEFSSVVLGREKTALFAEPIRIGGKVLSFRADENVSINLIMIRDDKSPFVWKGVGVTGVVSGGRSMYKIVASGDGFEMNRRGAFRMFVGCNGVAQMGINKKAVEVIVKDVSESGYSFVSKENYDELVGKAIRLVFKDLDMNFSLMGNVVRKVDIDETKHLYGCELSVPNANLLKYINEKQRQMLSMNRGNAAGKQKEMLEASLKEPPPIDSITDDDVDYKHKSIKNDGTHKARDLNTVGRTERRDIFKDNYAGKKV